MIPRSPTVIAALVVAASSSASAAVISGMATGGTALSDGGQFIELDSNLTFSVGNNNFQDPNLYAFDEDQNITIPSTITVDIGTAPTAGQVVASHYVFFDPLGTRSQTGFVDFDAPIFGVATRTATLAASDFLLNSNVTYLNPGLRGLEAGDSVMIDPAVSNRLLVDWTAGSPGDYVRVFTQRSPSGPPTDNGDGNPEVIPLPAGLPLYLGALALLGLARRPRRARATA